MVQADYRRCSRCYAPIMNPAGWTGKSWFCETCAVDLDSERPTFSTPEEEADFKATLSEDRT